MPLALLHTSCYKMLNEAFKQTCWNSTRQTQSLSFPSSHSRGNTSERIKYTVIPNQLSTTLELVCVCVSQHLPQGLAHKCWINVGGIHDWMNEFNLPKVNLPKQMRFRVDISLEMVCSSRFSLYSSLLLWAPGGWPSAFRLGLLKGICQQDISAREKRKFKVWVLPAPGQFQGHRQELCCLFQSVFVMVWSKIHMWKP